MIADVEASEESVGAPAGVEAEQRRERRALTLSTAASAAAAAVGIGWGLAVASQVLLLNGVYALLGMVLTLVTVQVARLVSRGPSTGYPFGRESLGPLMVGMQGLLLFGTLAYAVVDAILALSSGGSDAGVGSALVYAVLSLLLSVVLTVAMRRSGSSSELVAVEAGLWLASAVLSAAMVVGFAVAVGLERGGAADAAGYVDPLLVIIASGILLPTPLRMLRGTFRDFLEAAPGPEVEEPVVGAIEEVRGEFGLSEPTLRVSKLGRKVYVEVDFVVEEGRFVVGDADRFRRELERRLATPGRVYWIRAGLHTDPEWDQ